jgi:predicted nucleic acid-binding protein
MARLIDSSVLISLERRDGALQDLKTFTNGDEIAIASITASELLAGVHRAVPSERRLRRERLVEAVLSEVLVVPFDLKIARVHARIWTDLESRGQRIGTFDLMIAASALAHEYTLVTENRREFDRIPDLIVESPSWDDDKQ